MAENLLSLYTNGLFGVVSTFIGIALIYLRLKARDLPTTQSQGWGLTLLAWLFLTNAAGMFISYFHDIDSSLGITLIFLDIQGVPPLFLIGFALVFPQPIVRPSRIWMLFLLLACLSVVSVTMVMYPTITDTYFDKPFSSWQGQAMNVGWVIALLRWVQLYVKNQNRPEISMITTLLIWGVLYTSIYYLVLNPFMAYQPDNFTASLNIATNVFFVLATAAILIICYQLYIRRQNWQLSERIHVFMLMFSVGMGLFFWFAATGTKNGTEGDIIPLYRLLSFMVYSGGQNILRPLLIVYSILAFQFFGHELKAEQPIVLVATIMMAFLGGYFVSFLFMSPSMYYPGEAGFVSFVVFLVPSYFASQRLVKRWIPAVRNLSRKEARDIYYTSFFSALHNGTVEDPRDNDALTDLRKRLNITEREHSLLVKYERSRARIGMAVNKIRYALFVKESGQLLGSVGLMGDKDNTILAGMLTAVRIFIKDAFGTTKGDVDEIQYGDTKLLMEWERGHILAVEVEGEIDPATKTVVGDILAVLIRRHWKILKDWDGDMGLLKPIQEDLDILITNYNKTGSL
jgi:hypothetical protein